MIWIQVCIVFITLWLAFMLTWACWTASKRGERIRLLQAMLMDCQVARDKAISSGALRWVNCTNPGPGEDTRHGWMLVYIEGENVPVRLTSGTMQQGIDAARNNEIDNPFKVRQ